MHEMLYLLNCIQISILSIASGSLERLFPTPSAELQHLAHYSGHKCGYTVFREAGLMRLAL